MKDADVRVSELTARQHGLIANRQARALGLTRRQIDGRLRAGHLIVVHRGVYRTAASLPTWEQAVMAACLAVDGFASHRCAARVWDLRGIDSRTVEVCVARPRWPRLAGVVFHATERLERGDVTVRHRIPVTTPERTLLDLGAVEPVLVEPALDDALVRGLVTMASVRQLLDRIGARGRDGTAVLRRLVDDRPDGQGASESPLEDALVRLLRRHGLPEPVRQHAVAQPGGRMLRIDLAYPDVELGIEADGRLWHSGRADFQRDRARGNALTALGWTVLRYTWTDVRTRPQHVAAEVSSVRRALQQRAS